MSENTLQPANPVLFFISRLFILVGMVLFFTFVFLGFGFVLAKWMFGVDVMANPTIMQEMDTNPAVLQTMKLVQGLNSIGTFLLPAMLFPRALQLWPSEFIRSSVKPDAITVLLSLLVLVVSMPFISQLIQWNEAFVFPPELAGLEMKLKETQASAERMTKAFVQSNGTGGFITNVFLIAFLPAICEEFLFRGTFMRFLIFCFKKEHIAVILSAFVFSMMHGEFYGFVPRFVLGIFLGYITVYSNSIWPAVAMHFLNNSLALLAMHFHWDESGIFFFDDSYIFPFYITALSGIAAIALIWAIYRKNIKPVLYNGE
ncbi:MAG: CPBP family intramembrane glutamic endopeptidase [Bacteroidia bacterium]|jgi:hypothetical protein